MPFRPPLTPLITNPAAPPPSPPALPTRADTSPRAKPKTSRSKHGKPDRTNGTAPTRPKPAKPAPNAPSRPRIHPSRLADLSAKFFNPVFAPRAARPPPPLSRVRKICYSRLPPPCAEVDDLPTVRTRRWKVWDQSYTPLRKVVLDVNLRGQLRRYQSFALPANYQADYQHPVKGVHRKVYPLGPDVFEWDDRPYLSTLRDAAFRRRYPHANSLYSGPRCTQSSAYSLTPASTPPVTPLYPASPPDLGAPVFSPPRPPANNAAQRKDRRERLLQHKWILEQEQERRWRAGMRCVMDRVTRFQETSMLEPHKWRDGEGMWLPDFDPAEVVELGDMFKAIRQNPSIVFELYPHIRPVAGLKEVEQEVASDKEQRDERKQKKENRRGLGAGSAGEDTGTKPADLQEGEPLAAATASTATPTTSTPSKSRSARPKTKTTAPPTAYGDRAPASRGTGECPGEKGSSASRSSTRHQSSRSRSALTTTLHSGSESALPAATPHESSARSEVPGQAAKSSLSSRTSTQRDPPAPPSSTSSFSRSASNAKAKGKTHRDGYDSSQHHPRRQAKDNPAELPAHPAKSSAQEQSPRPPISLPKATKAPHAAFKDAEDSLYALLADLALDGVDRQQLQALASLLLLELPGTGESALAMGVGGGGSSESEKLELVSSFAKAPARRDGDTSRSTSRRSSPRSSEIRQNQAFSVPTFDTAADDGRTRADSAACPPSRLGAADRRARPRERISSPSLDKGLDLTSPIHSPNATPRPARRHSQTSRASSASFASSDSSTLLPASLQTLHNSTSTTSPLGFRYGSVNLDDDTRANDSAESAVDTSWGVKDDFDLKMSSRN